MTLKERCQASETRLAQVSTALLDPRHENLADCETYLQEAIDLLEAEQPEQENKADLLRLSYKIRLLDLQVQQATNLCQGLMQLGSSEGYTDQGTPALAPSEPRSSYEV